MDSDEILKAELKKAVAECERLREENARLRVRVGQASDTLAPTPNQFSAHNNKSTGVGHRNGGVSSTTQSVVVQ